MTYVTNLGFTKASTFWFISSNRGVNNSPPMVLNSCHKTHSKDTGQSTAKAFGSSLKVYLSSRCVIKAELFNFPAYSEFSSNLGGERR